VRWLVELVGWGARGGYLGTGRAVSSRVGKGSAMRTTICDTLATRVEPQGGGAGWQRRGER
jgi:hypothetical protein